MEEDLIYDMGMYDGNDTAYYLSEGFRVVAIEANPYWANKNKQQFKKQIKEGKLKILNVGITKERKKVIKFYVNKTHSEWSSFDKNIGCRHKNHPAVRYIDESNCDFLLINTLPLLDIFKKYGIPYYLKIDIEGNDYLFIDALVQLSSLPKYISCEVGEYQTVPSIQSLLRLPSLGYSKFKLVKQGSHKNGFSSNSSGPFGEETVDIVSGTKWRSLAAIMETLKEQNQKGVAWHDWHGKLEI